MSFAGQAVQTSSADLAAGRRTGPLVDVEFHVEATMAVPPWIQGALRPEARRRLETSVEGDLMGGPRYEQLFRAAGTVDPTAREHRFTGSGLRIRRQGVRQLAGLLWTRLAVGAFPERRAPSATSPIRPATTGSRRSTRAICSTVTAT